MNSEHTYYTTLLSFDSHCISLYFHEKRRGGWRRKKIVKVIFNMLPRILIKNHLKQSTSNMNIKCYSHSLYHHHRNVELAHSSILDFSFLSFLFFSSLIFYIFIQFKLSQTLMGRK